MNATRIGIAAVIVAAVIAVCWIIYLAYRLMEDKTLDEIREKVYQLFLQAEHMFKSESGQEKLQWVVQKTRCLLPGWLSFILSESTLTKIIQAWFDTVKDLLDDGELNGSHKETEAEAEIETGNEAEGE